MCLAPLACDRISWPCVCFACICLCVYVLPFISNIFFSETTHCMLTKLHRNDLGMTVIRNSSKLIAMATTLKNIENLQKSSCSN